MENIIIQLLATIGGFFGLFTMLYNSKKERVKKELEAEQRHKIEDERHVKMCERFGRFEQKMDMFTNYIDFENLSKAYRTELEHIAEEELMYLHKLNLNKKFAERCRKWLSYRIQIIIDTAVAITSKEVRDINQAYFSSLMASYKEDIERFAVDVMGADFYTDKIKKEQAQRTNEVICDMQEIMNDKITNNKIMRLKERGRRCLREQLRSAMFDIQNYSNEKAK